MLTFTAFDDDHRSGESVHIDPLSVAAVHETSRRRAYGFKQPVAIVSLVTGERFTVYDYSRDVGQKIAEAKAAARSGVTTGPVAGAWGDEITGT